jgi:hypothetical protein
VTVNSDDPAYFGGSIADNLLAAQQALPLTASQLYQLIKNAIHAAFVPAPAKQALFDRAAAAYQQPSASENARREVTRGLVRKMCWLAVPASTPWCVKPYCHTAAPGPSAAYRMPRCATLYPPLSMRCTTARDGLLALVRRSRIVHGPALRKHRRCRWPSTHSSTRIASRVWHLSLQNARRCAVSEVVQRRLPCQARLHRLRAWRRQALRDCRLFPCQAVLPGDSTPPTLSRLSGLETTSPQSNVVAWHSLCSPSESDDGLLPPSQCRV